MKRIILPGTRTGLPVITNRAEVALRLRWKSEANKERDQKFEEFIRKVTKVKE